jgi:hypothetical protein
LKILLDESVPVQVRNALVGHDVSTVSGLGWKGMENGALLTAIEQTDIEIFVIADKNLRYQQNLTSRRVAIVELWTNHRPTLERNFAMLTPAILSAAPGSYVVVTAP